MLAEPKKGGTAKGIEYHEQEAYFQIGADQGIFYGKLAEELGFLDQPMNEQTIFAAHQGQNAKGEQLVKLRPSELDKEGLRSTSFTDLTFSADKSISLAYEVALKENPRLAAKIAEAFQGSVKDALDYVESEYMYSRTDEPAQPKMLSAVYFHNESRKDNEGFISPSLHAHALAMSITQDVTGKYRKMENYNICTDHKHIGLVQRAALAKRLQEVGVEIEVYDAKKAFIQIKGFNQEHREIFSGRHEMVQAAKEELKKLYPNMKDSKLEEMAKVQTRNWKDKTIDREAIRDENIERAHGFGYELPKLNEKSVLKQTMTQNQVLSQAIDDLTEHQSVFSNRDLLSQALKIGLDQGIVLADVKEAITNNIDLVKTRKGWTTREMIALESKILAQKDNKSSDFIVSNAKEADKAIAEYQTRKGFELKKGQAELVHAALNSDSQFIVAQGVAGAGKTTSLEVVKAVCDSHGRNIIGLAPQATQAQNLQAESGIKSNTVASFLLNEELQASAKNSVIILDEAGMLGMRDMHKLITIAKAQNAKLILSGDINQKKSISQGDAFKMLQEQGFTTVTLDEGNRQKTNDLKIAVKHILNHDIEAAIKTLQASTSDAVVELTDRDARLLKAKEEYLKDPENSLLMARTNVDRRELNKMIRDELLSQGKITNSSSFPTREIPNMDALEKRQSRYYQEGQTLYLSKNLGKISAGRNAKIVSIDKENNTLVIEHEGQSKGKKTLIKETVNLSREGHNLNIYAETKTDFGVNDTIIFKKKDKNLGLLNGHIGKITNIEGEKITALVNDKSVAFTTKQYPYIQHGYCVTDFSAQGRSVNTAIMLSDQANYNDFYTQLTRSKFSAKIITPSIENLIKSTARESVKLNALSEANISTVKKLKQIIKGYENGRIHRVIAKSANTARNYHRSATNTITDLSRTLKRFAQSSAEQWRQSSLRRAFSSDKGVNNELKELQKSIKEVKEILNKTENKSNLKERKNDMIEKQHIKQPKVREIAQEHEEQSSQSR